MELKFRPEDPCAHAAFGELSQSSDLLLRIRRKRRNNLPQIDEASGINVEDNAEEFETRADIVARIEHTYNFDGMADYQYVLAVHADAARKRQKRQREMQGLGNLMDVEQDELMMLVPPLFSIKDMPEETVMRPSDFVSKKLKRKNKTDTAHMEANSMPCFAVDFKIPEVPAITRWEDELVKQTLEYNLTAATVRLFEERPIWAKLTLLDRLADLGVVITDAHVKRLLFRTGYYFGYGPFRTLWIRNGYDPRNAPESRMYQMMDFRIPRTLRDGSSGPERSSAKDSGPAWRDICTFKAAPSKKFSFVQLFDLQDDFIQEQIRKPPERTSCSEYTGWYRRSTLERLRHHIRVRFLDLMPAELAREIQSLQRISSKTVTWKGDDEIPNNAEVPHHNEVPASEPTIIVTEHAGVGIQTLSELNFTPLPSEDPYQEEPVAEIESEADLPTVEAEEDLEAEDAAAAAAAAELQVEEEEEEESDEEEDEEEEEEEDDDDIEMPPEPQDGVLGDDRSDKMPDGFLQELLKKFPFGQGYGEVEGHGGADDDAEYAIYEVADEEDDDDEN